MRRVSGAKLFGGALQPRGSCARRAGDADGGRGLRLPAVRAWLTGDERADFFAEDDATEVVRAEKVEDNDGHLVVHANGILNPEIIQFFYR